MYLSIYLYIFISSSFTCQFFFLSFSFLLLDTPTLRLSLLALICHAIIFYQSLSIYLSILIPSPSTHYPVSSPFFVGLTSRYTHARFSHSLFACPTTLPHPPPPPILFSPPPPPPAINTPPAPRNKAVEDIVSRGTLPAYSRHPSLPSPRLAFSPSSHLPSAPVVTTGPFTSCCSRYSSPRGHFFTRLLLGVTFVNWFCSPDLIRFVCLHFLSRVLPEAWGLSVSLVALSCVTCVPDLVPLLFLASHSSPTNSGTFILPRHPYISLPQGVVIGATLGRERDESLHWVLLPWVFLHPSRTYILISKTLPPRVLLQHSPNYRCCRLHLLPGLLYY